MKVIFVGLDGIPSGKRAIDVRIDALAKLTVRVGYNVEVINRFSKSVVVPPPSYKVFDPYDYVNKESLGPMRSFIYYILALFKEPFVILKSNKREKVDVIVTSSGHFVDTIVYKVLSRCIGAKLVYEYCEYRSAVKGRGLYHTINGWLLDNVSPIIWDGAICISHFLEEACKSINSRVVTTIIYPLCDFKDYCEVQTIHENYDYVMFCGSVEYDETLKIVMESFKLSSIAGKYKLFLVLRGDSKRIEKISKEKDVIVKTNLAYDDLIGYLKGAQALLIPVDNTIRDTARFPNKICEYGAVGGLIVTVNNGEMPFVFHDKKNALVADSFSSKSFASKLNELNMADIELDTIKTNGARTCKELFDIDSNIDRVTEFYRSLFV